MAAAISSTMVTLSTSRSPTMLNRRQRVFGVHLPVGAGQVQPRVGEVPCVEVEPAAGVPSGAQRTVIGGLSRMERIVLGTNFSVLQLPMMFIVSDRRARRRNQ
jgi:hypothetical protein